MSTEPTTNQTGGCLCGGVRYAVKGKLRPVVYCHCGQCRKTSGNYVAATACELDKLIIERDDSLRWFVSSPLAKRGFCSECGSNLFWRANDATHMSIFAGTLDSAKNLQATAHIFVESAPEYLLIGDELPQYDQRGPDEITSVKE